MNTLKLYNTLSLKKEEFKPIKSGEVGLYTCGPTVYNYAHIGNLRTYLFEDFLKRTLEYDGYEVLHVMNITDVGHLTGNMDMGEDKLEVGAKREGKSALEVAAFYEVAFKKDLAALNIEEPNIYCRATENIPEQIELIMMLESKGYTYKTSDGVYFDTSLVKDYNKLSHLPLEELREGARVEKNPEKRNPTDFALWKFSPTPSEGGAKRQMEWDSPWGIGFPGWHIECSAMSQKYLGEELDIHCGGIDHINIHHTNEIAQSEAATGKKFFNYWVHGAFLNIKGGKKMAKSDGNFLTLDKALIAANINPLAYRFSALQVHYRKPMEFSEDGLKQALEGLNSLLIQVAGLGSKVGKIDSEFKEKFLGAINDDLNFAKALATLAAVLKSKLNDADKLGTILDFDRVLGLRLDLAKNYAPVEFRFTDLASDVQALINARQEARDAKNWEESDRLRLEIRKKGYLIEDIKNGFKVSQL
ncbi:MAG: cysteine--tRNA ligase [Patescibacteria group bacterium]